jgi:hypothetical protein
MVLTFMANFSLDQSSEGEKLCLLCPKGFAAVANVILHGFRCLLPRPYRRRRLPAVPVLQERIPQGRVLQIVRSAIVDNTIQASHQLLALFVRKARFRTWRVLLLGVQGSTFLTLQSGLPCPPSVPEFGCTVLV